MELETQNQVEFFNEEAEKAILGTAIQNNVYLLRVSDFLEEKHFYFDEHKAIWRKFVEVARDMTANSITLQNFFQDNEALQAAGGVAYLKEIMLHATGIIDIRDYGRVVVELWQKREIEILLKNSLEELKTKNFNSIAANLSNEINGLELHEPRKKTQHVAELISEMDADDAIGLSTKFVPTGFAQLDQLMNGGIHAQQLCIVGARPSVGKTTLGQNIILNASKAGKRCLFISLEVDKRNVMYKFLSSMTSVETWKIQKQILNQSDILALNRAKQDLRERGIYVNDSSYLKIGQIGQLIKNQVQKQPVDLVVVDYVQIIRGDDTKGKNEALIIKENTTALKAFAKQFDVAVLALAQINRKAVEGGSQEPTINDFKSSGGIEEDADVAIILHRNRSEGKKDSYFSENGKFIVAKNRHGRTGQIEINFDGNFGRFSEIGGF